MLQVEAQELGGDGVEIDLIKGRGTRQRRESRSRRDFGGT
jgi:hypothetical protein